MRTFFARPSVVALLLGQVGQQLDLQARDLERFITATRRQNFLTPPRRHRSFPLLEKT